MSDIDLSLVVTAHNETVVCGPTMKSANLAVEHARTSGFSVEKILALDSISNGCREFFFQSAFDDWQRVELQQCDLGRTRNEIIANTCRGKNIAFLDSDDLFSENWLLEGLMSLNHAQESGIKAIVHPELNWLFDGENNVFTKIPQDSPFFLEHHFYFSNYYDSLCMAPRQAHEEIRYVHRDIPNGLSFQDWQFSIETMAVGWYHMIAKDTIIFKRRRDESLVTESRNRRSIVRFQDIMSIDTLKKLTEKRK